AELGGDFTLLVFGDAAAVEAALRGLPAALPRPRLVAVAAEREGDAALVDLKGVAFRRYDARPGTAYLVRPDQHVAARWREADARSLSVALARALGREDEAHPLAIAGE